MLIAQADELMRDQERRPSAIWGSRWRRPVPVRQSRRMPKVSFDHRLVQSLPHAHCRPGGRPQSGRGSGSQAVTPHVLCKVVQWSCVRAAEGSNVG
eukprot:723043-Amphidinium_carterae.1